MAVSRIGLAVSAATICALIIVGVRFVPESESSRDEALRTVWRAARDKREQLAKDTYLASKAKINAEARAAMDARNYARAVQLTEKWEQFADADTLAILKVARQFDEEQKGREAKKLAAVEAKEVALQAALDAEAAAKEDRREARIGQMPVASAWDGSYDAIDRFLEAEAHDPDSVEFIGCTPIYESQEGWRTRCEFRAKNAFGALIKQNMLFVIRHGVVVSADPIPGG